MERPKFSRSHATQSRLIVALTVCAWGLVVCAVAQGQQTDRERIFTFEDEGQLLANPGCGWQRFESTTNNAGFPSATLYARFNWSAIEPTVGTYNFSSIDDRINSMRAAHAPGLSHHDLRR